MQSLVNLLLAEAEINKLRFTLDGSGAEMAFMPSSGISDAFKACPELMKAVDEISKARKTPPLNVMLNRLGGGVIVPAHRDWLKPTKLQPENPIVERWHLPIITNGQAVWWDVWDGSRHLPQGIWFGPVPYWITHSVGNYGLEDRIHLVVDLDSPYPIGVYQ